MVRRLGIASAAFALWWRRAVSQVLQSANAPVHQLNLLAEVLAVVEEEQAAPRSSRRFGGG